MENTPKEWQLISNIRRQVQRQSDHTIVGLGDDAFVYKNFPGYTVICQDMMVEEIHFRRAYTSAFDLGYKSLASNLSDIVAMGAKPHFAQVSLALPKNLNESWLDEFYKGMLSLADRHHVEIVGGDLTASPDKIVIDVSIQGSTEAPITRKETRTNDLLLCSGPLGLSYTGFVALNEELAGYENAKQKHLRPEPRLDLLSSLLKNRSRIHSLMDCSDGLINDASQLLSLNQGLKLFAEKIPMHPETQRLSVEKSKSVYDFILWGGEDYQLLMTVPKEEIKFFPEWTVIGEVTSSNKIEVVYSDRTEEITEFKGWAHF